jgi:hypothetical protein
MAGFEFPYGTLISFAELQDILNSLSDYNIDTDLLLDNVNLAQKTTVQSLRDIFDVEICFPMFSN